MPLRYGKKSLQVFREYAQWLQNGELTHPAHSRFLHKYRKVLRELTQNEDKRLVRPRKEPKITQHQVDFLTILTAHGTTEYRKLVRSAKIKTPLI